MTKIGYCLAFLTISILPACAVAEQPDSPPERELGTLVTDGYEVTLRTECAEGEVSCDRIYADALVLEGNQTRALRGSTLHTLCADGVSPCRFLGYQLSDDTYDYRVLENGQLHIQRCDEFGCESIHNEQGQWQF